MPTAWVIYQVWGQMLQWPCHISNYLWNERPEKKSQRFFFFITFSFMFPSKCGFVYYDCSYRICMHSSDCRENEHRHSSDEHIGQIEFFHIHQSSSYSPNRFYYDSPINNKIHRSHVSIKGALFLPSTYFSHTHTRIHRSRVEYFTRYCDAFIASKWMECVCLWYVS